MSRTVEAIFKDGKVRLLEPLDLPDETPLKIIIEDAATHENNTNRSRRDDPLASIYEIAEDIGPADLAVNLDHYLY
ncbi:MAG: antitoxin family protein [Pyrinomonadaceae bacterium]